MSWNDLFNFVLAFGALQGLVFGAILWSTSASVQRNANRFLAIILVFFSYRLTFQLLKNIEVIHVESWLYHVFLEYDWIYGTLIFFYVRAYAQPRYKLKRRDLVHFLPIAIEIIISNFIKSQNFFWDGTRESLSWLGYYGYILWMHTPFQFIVAMSLVLFYTHRARSQILKANHSEVRKIKRRYARRLEVILTVYFAFSILIISISLMDFLFFDYAFNPFYIYPTYITMSLLTYWLGIQGVLYRNADIFEKNRPLDNKQGLEEIVQKLKLSMEKQKIYLDPSLNLHKLADNLDLKPYLITRALNGILGKSFNEFVNEYRVREVLARINHPQNENKTLLAIAFESGFNSKASFNRIVKKLTGKSPKELKNKESDSKLQ